MREESYKTCSGDLTIMFASYINVQMYIFLHIKKAYVQKGKEGRENKDAHEISLMKIESKTSWYQVESGTAAQIPLSQCVYTYIKGTVHKAPTEPRLQVIIDNKNSIWINAGNCDVGGETGGYLSQQGSWIMRGQRPNFLTIRRDNIVHSHKALPFLVYIVNESYALSKYCSINHHAIEQHFSNRSCNRKSFSVCPQMRETTAQTSRYGQRRPI